MAADFKVYALKTHQWLDTWDDVGWEDSDLKRKPLEQSMFLFSVPAKLLKRLSGVYKRDTKTRTLSSEDYGIQRKHDPDRSLVIQEYVKNGYPWSELNKGKRQSGKFDDLKKPGWLPTAIVLNILTSKDTRRGKHVDEKDLIKIENIDEKLSRIILPSDAVRDDYKFRELPPIEIIDGQHRLWAFEDTDIDDDFELPVVAFNGLGLSWQAYLFYTINISPKKINRSLAFDLYPLLRNEEWLERFDGHNIYRETRAQEIVDILNSHSESPWKDWINMLGESDGGSKKVSQSAWIRSLTATFIKSFDPKNRLTGGLYGAPIGEDQTMLPWGKEEQASIIIYFGSKVLQYIKNSNQDWIESLRAESSRASKNQPSIFVQEVRDPAFYGRDSLLNQDQGIRTILHVLNDFLYINHEQLKLTDFYLEYAEGDTLSLVSQSLQAISGFPIKSFLENLASSIVLYDWRSFNSPSLAESTELKAKKAGFRGSGGYKVLREDVLSFLSKMESNEIGESAAKLID